MSSIQMLSASVLFTALMWVPYVLERIARIGLMGAMANPSQEASDPAPWAVRAAAAHANAIENLVLFAAAMGVAVAMGRQDEGMVTMAATVYFVARLLHYVVYVAGVPVARTLSFAGGWAATLAVLYGAMG